MISGSMSAYSWRSRCLLSSRTHDIRCGRGCHCSNARIQIQLDIRIPIYTHVQCISLHKCMLS